MLAGGGTLFHDSLGISYFIGVLITLVFIIITLLLKAEGIFTVNSFIIPILICITATTILAFVVNVDSNLDIKNIPVKGGWLPDAFLYGSYNLAIAVAAMTSIVAKEKKADVIRGSIIGGLILFLLNLLLYMGLIKGYPFVLEEDLPTLYFARVMGKRFLPAHIVSLYFAMVSTAISNFYAFNQRIISLFNIKYKAGLILSVLIIIPLVSSGFSVLVKILYPVFGYLGLFIISYYIYLFYKKLC